MFSLSIEHTPPLIDVFIMRQVYQDNPVAASNLDQHWGNGSVFPMGNIKKASHDSLLFRQLQTELWGPGDIPAASHRATALFFASGNAPWRFDSSIAPLNQARPACAGRAWFGGPIGT